MRFEVVLRFRADAPAVTGVWDDEDTARRKYTAQVGLYGAGEAVVELVEVTADGERRVLKSWPPPDDGADRRQAGP